MTLSTKIYSHHYILSTRQDITDHISSPYSCAVTGTSRPGIHRPAREEEALLLDDLSNINQPTSPGSQIHCTPLKLVLVLSFHHRNLPLLSDCHTPSYTHSGPELFPHHMIQSILSLPLFSNHIWATCKKNHHHHKHRTCQVLWWSAAPDHNQPPVTK